MAEERDKAEIAIVGGGIAGLFCAYVLRKKRKSVRLFEATKRLGGRIRTIRLDKDNNPIDPGTDLLEKLEFHAEFGAMRFDTKRHPLLGALLKHLGFSESDDAGHLKLETFPTYSSPPSSHDPQYELGPFEKDRDPYQLLQIACMRIMSTLTLKGTYSDIFDKKKNDLIRDVSLAAGLGEDPLRAFLIFADSLVEDDFWLIQRHGHVPLMPRSHENSSETVPLFTVGFWNLLSAHLSHDSLNKLRDIGTFFHLIPENPNAAEWLTWWLRGFAISDNLKTVKGGMETITETLYQEIEDGGKCSGIIQSGHRVIKLLQVEGGIRLKLQTTGNCGGEPTEEKKGPYSKVILALPKSPLEKLILRSAGIFKKPQHELETLLDSSYGFPLVKVFFVVKNRWWEEENRTNKYATRVPTRELHFMKGKTNGSKQGLIMIYADRPTSAFWGNFVLSGPHEDVGWGLTEDLTDEAERFTKEYLQRDRMEHKLVRYLNENDVPDFRKEDIAWVGIRDWGRDPYGGGNHAWRPKRRYWHAMKELASLELRNPESGNLVCICGEAYSDYHGFIEGALRSAVYALSKILEPEVDAPDLQWLDMIDSDPDAAYKKDLRNWIKRLNSDPDRGVY